MMSTKSTFALTLTCAFLASTALLAQDEPSCLRRTVVASVVTREKSEVVVDLTASNFRGQFRGKPVQILSVERASGPNRAVILLDTSGSMGDSRNTRVSPKLTFAIGFALAIASQSPETSRLAFMTFSDKVENQAGFDRTRNDIAQAIRLLGTKEHPAAKGKTALLDAIMQAFHLMEPSSPQDVIYLLTDGGESSSRASGATAKQALVKSGVRLYTIVLSDINPPSQEELLGLMMVTELSELSGGAAFTVWDVDISKEGEMRRQAMAKGLINRVTESYRLEVELPQVPEKKQGWKLEVVGLPNMKGGVRVFYPHDLLPCSDVTPKD